MYVFRIVHCHTWGTLPTRIRAVGSSSRSVSEDSGGRSTLPFGSNELLKFVIGCVNQKKKKKECTFVSYMSEVDPAV